MDIYKDEPPSTHCHFPLFQLCSVHDSPLLILKGSCKFFVLASEPSDTSSLAYKLLYTWNWKWSAMSFMVMHPHPHSFLGTGTWGHDLHCRKDEGRPCVCMCACAVMAQWEVDDECFWLDNWFAPVFTFNLWWAWSVEGSQSGTAGFNPKRLNGSSKSHRKLCHSLTNAYWEFPLFSDSFWLQLDRAKKKIIQFYIDFHSPKTDPPEIWIYVIWIYIAYIWLLHKSNTGYIIGNGTCFAVTERVYSSKGSFGL